MKNKQKRGTVDIIFGGQAGSEAKGKVAGYYALRGGYVASIANFMPNAGHTWIGELRGEKAKVMVQTLPQAIVNDELIYLLSAGSAIELKLLIKEIKDFDIDPSKIYIDPRAVIVTPKHAEAEGKAMGYISSTQKGCGEALAGKVKRSKDVILWQDIAKKTHNGSLHCEELVSREILTYSDVRNILPQIKTVRTQDIANKLLNDGVRLLIEAPQGYDLDINHGVEYPYCTSRQTTPAQAIADAGIAMQTVDKVIAVIRPYPIRVGNQYDSNGKLIGSSGSYPTKEITWEEIAKRSGMPAEEIKELTTVTQKLRRVFEPNLDYLHDMVQTTGATHIALNFANYIDYNVQGVMEVRLLTDKVVAFIASVEVATGVPVIYLGTGAEDHEAIEFTGTNRIILDHKIAMLRNIASGRS